MYALNSEEIQENNSVEVHYKTAFFRQYETAIQLSKAN